jgi:ketosteroid isomerase-like protein
MRRWPFATVFAGVLLSSTVAFTAPAVAAATDTTATKTTTTTASSAAVKTAQPLVTKFFTLVQNKDKAGLEKFMSPAFQLERADGSGLDKNAYLQNISTVQSFNLTDFAASRTGDVLVVRYLADATGIVNGKPYTPGPAPRLSVFKRDGKKWQIVAHANFNPLNG